MLGVLSALLAATAPHPAPGADAEGYEQRLIDWGLALHGREVEARPEGKVIEEVLVAAEEVFAPSDPWPSLLNIFHLRTREGVLRREVLAQAGEQWDGGRIEETERILRRLFILAVARVVPVKGRAGGVGLLVVTKDRWSLRLNSDFSLVGDLLQYLRLQPTEANFLGRNQQLTVDFQLRLDTLQVAEVFVEPRLFGTELYLGESAGLILNRQTLAPEGSTGQLVLARPLRSLTQRWGFAVEGSWNSRRRRVFRGASVDRLPYPEAGSAVTVPYVFDVREGLVDASVTRSFGAAWKGEFTASVGGYARSYAPPAEAPLDEAQRAWLTENYLPRTENATYLYGYFRAFKPDFRVLKSIDVFELSEDFQIGGLVQFGARWALPVFSGTQHFVDTGAGVRWRFLLAEDLLTLSLSAAARLVPGGPVVNKRVAAEVVNHSPPFHGGRLVTRLLVDLKQDDLDNRVVYLGGGNGLRGAEAELLSGRNLALLNIEYRTRAIELIPTVYVGFVLFYDAGSAFDTTPAVTHTLGLGARILLPQFNQETIRLDLGFVLGGEGRFTGDRFSASYGQVTDVRAGSRVGSSYSFLDDPI